MSTLASIRESYRLTATRHPQTFVGVALTGPVNGTIRGTDSSDWRIITGDDLDDYAPTGPVYRTKGEAMGALDEAIARFYGIAPNGKAYLDNDTRDHAVARASVYTVSYVYTGHRESIDIVADSLPDALRRVTDTLHPDATITAIVAHGVARV